MSPTQKNDILTFDLFNISQRHTANTFASVHLKMSGSAMRNLSTLSSQQHAEVLRFLTKNLRGAAYMEARSRLNVAQ